MSEFSSVLRKEHPDIFSEKENGNMFSYSGLVRVVRAVENSRHVNGLRFNAFEMGPEKIYVQEVQDARILLRQNYDYMHTGMDAYGDVFTEHDDRKQSCESYGIVIY